MRVAVEPSDDIQLLENFLQDDDLESLEDIAQEFNVFEVLGAVWQEIRNSNFLAWLLDPAANHGLGDYFLKRFLWKTTSLAKERSIGTITPIDVDGLDLGSVSVRREWRAIDILLLSDAQQFVCAIENKVGAAEHSGQLERYAGVCRNEFPDYAHHFVFLTAHGDEPSDQDWIAIDHGFVCDSVERMIHAKEASLGDEVRIFLRHYCSMLRRHIMGESTIVELCQKIYAKHQRALDLLFEYRPDKQTEVKNIIEQIVSEDSDFELVPSGKAYIHFAPSSWASPELRESGEGTARILTFMFQNSPEYLRLHLEIQPGDQSIRTHIHEIARQSSNFSAPAKLYSRYCRIFKRDFLRASDYEEHDMEWIEQHVRQRFAAFKSSDFPQIDEVIRGISF
jgi:hypothetical protein